MKWTKTKENRHKPRIRNKKKTNTQASNIHKLNRHDARKKKRLQNEKRSPVFHGCELLSTGGKKQKKNQSPGYLQLKETMPNTWHTNNLRAPLSTPIFFVPSPGTSPFFRRSPRPLPYPPHLHLEFHFCHIRDLTSLR